MLAQPFRVAPQALGEHHVSLVAELSAGLADVRNQVVVVSRLLALFYRRIGAQRGAPGRGQVPDRRADARRQVVRLARAAPLQQEAQAANDVVYVDEVLLLTP